MTQQEHQVCLWRERAFAYKISIGIVTPCESTKKLWKLEVELAAPNDAIWKLEEVMITHEHRTTHGRNGESRTYEWTNRCNLHHGKARGQINIIRHQCERMLFSACGHSHTAIGVVHVLVSVGGLMLRKGSEKNGFFTDRQEHTSRDDGEIAGAATPFYVVSANPIWSMRNRRQSKTFLGR